MLYKPFFSLYLDRFDFTLDSGYTRRYLCKECVYNPPYTQIPLEMKHIFKYHKPWALVRGYKRVFKVRTLDADIVFQCTKCNKEHLFFFKYEKVSHNKRKVKYEQNTNAKQNS